MYKLIFFISLSIICNYEIVGQVSGKVFRDFNGSGIYDNTLTYEEPLVSGIVVTAYDASGNIAGTAITNINGTYSIPLITGQFRIEFTSLSPGDFTSTRANEYGSSVQFVVAPVSNIDFALNSPQDYWNSQFPNDVSFLIPKHSAGAHDGLSLDTFAISQYYKTTQGVPTTSNAIINVPIIEVANLSEVGALWGQAFQKSKQRNVFTALAKRHADAGPQGLSGIYIVEENATGAPDVVSSFSLDGVSPSNGGSVIDLGTINRNNINDGNDYFIGNANNVVCRDLDAFNKIGKISYGDIDYDPVNKLFWTVNLNQRTLISIDASVASSTLNNATSAILNPITKSYNIVSLPGLPSSLGGQLRPWGLGFNKGFGYLGLVNDASTSKNKLDLKGYILRFDPLNPNAGFTTVMTLNLGNYHEWNPWLDSWSESNNSLHHPQPIISDISFTDNANMIINIMDRWGHQTGLNMPKAISGDNSLFYPVSKGDILMACFNPTTNSWNIEGTSPSCPQNHSDLFALLEGYGTTGKEYFSDLSGDGTNENNQGASLLLPGTHDLITIVIDPFPLGNTPSPVFYATGGYYIYDHTTGQKYQWTRIYPNEEEVGFGKANGLGDIEFYGMPPQPIEIGNRVWLDTDKDGIQDADETPIAGVIIELYADFNLDGIPDGNVLAKDTTDSKGTWYFSEVNVMDGDPLSLGNNPGLKIQSGYIVKIANTQFNIVGSGVLANLNLTTTNIGGLGQADVRDNDASNQIGSAQINLAVGDYGESNHTYDFGFIQTCNITSAGLSNVQCNNSATPSIKTDDYISFSLNPTGALLGSTYTVSSNNGGIVTPSTGSYGIATNFRLQNGSADNLTTYTITITDISGIPCQITVNIGPISSCSYCPNPNCFGVDVKKG
jgi:hypothetical protein